MADLSVAVLITCFNEGEYIGEALASVLAQTAQSAIAEIIIVDDGSDAATLQVLDRLEGSDPRLQVLRGPGGWGCAKARNHAVDQTQAPLLAFLDGDDAWLPEKLARQLAALAASPHIDGVYTGYLGIAHDGAPGRAVVVEDLSRRRRQLRRYFLHNPTILPSALLIHRSAYDRAGRFDDEVRLFEDTEFFLRLLRFGRLKGLREPLIRKRYRGGSLSTPGPALMPQHAALAFRAALADPALAHCVAPRLAERASRLALVAYYGGDLGAARRQAILARGLDRRNARAHLVLTLTGGGAALRRLLDWPLRGRRRLHAR